MGIQQFLPSVFGLILSAGLATAECIGTKFSSAVSSNGLFAVGIYDNERVHIWDLRRLGDPLQPVQVHRFEVDGLDVGSTIALAPNGARIAYLDDAADRLFACEMMPGFPCTHVLDLQEKADMDFLEWSPDGRQLALITDRPAVLRLLTFDAAGNVEKRQFIEWRSEPPAFDWRGARLAVGGGAGISIRDLSHLARTGTVRTLTHFPKALQFSADGTHVLAREGRTLRLYHANPERGEEHIEIGVELEDLEVMPGNHGRFWYVRELGAKDRTVWKVWQSDRSGFPPRGFPNLVGHEIQARDLPGRPIGMAAGGRMVLVSPGDCESGDVSVVRLSDSLPAYRLYPSRSEYSTESFGISHLPPRMGSLPGYRFDTGLTASVSTLLGHAEVAVSLKDRQDLLWLALQSKIHERPVFRSRWILTNILELVTDLIVSEFAFELGETEKAQSRAEGALALAEGLYPRLLPTTYLHPIDAEIWKASGRYVSTLQNELRLVLLKIAMAKGELETANSLANQILGSNAGDWRAHAGLLRAKLTAPDDEFGRILAEAQSALRQNGWTEEYITGYPRAFFDEAQLRELRRIALNQE